MTCNLIKLPISQMRRIITYCKFADAEAKTTVEHYLCSVQVKVSATAQFIFDKFNKFFEEHNFYLKKCKSATTDGAAAIQGSFVIRVCRMRGCGMLGLCLVLSVVPRIS